MIWRQIADCDLNARCEKVDLKTLAPAVRQTNRFKRLMRAEARFSHLNDYCRRGATAAVKRREERERIASLTARGCDEEALRPRDWFDEVEVCHLDPAWLEDRFIAQLAREEAELFEHVIVLFR